MTIFHKLPDVLFDIHSGIKQHKNLFEQNKKLLRQ